MSGMEITVRYAETIKNLRDLKGERWSVLGVVLALAGGDTWRLYSRRHNTRFISRVHVFRILSLDARVF